MDKLCNLRAPSNCRWSIRKAAKYVSGENGVLGVRQNDDNYNLATLLKVDIYVLFYIYFYS